MKLVATILVLVIDIDVKRQSSQRQLLARVC